MPTKSANTDKMQEALLRWKNDASLTTKERQATDKLLALMKEGVSLEERLRIFGLPIFKDCGLSNFDKVELLRKGNVEQGVMDKWMARRISDCIIDIHNHREYLAFERNHRTL